ncbi:MAG: hypothetical protein IPO93_15815 [Actinobacteria bacterium]|nr:hypothetical protein [Actinomycetota bacterium]
MVRCRAGRPGHDVPQQRFSITHHSVIEYAGPGIRARAADADSHYVEHTFNVSITDRASTVLVGAAVYDDEDYSPSDAAQHTSGHCAPHDVASPGQDRDSSPSRTSDPSSTTTDDEGVGSTWWLVGAGPLGGSQ